MKFSISLLEQDKDIRISILQSLQAIMDKALQKAIVYIEPKIRLLVRQALYAEPEYTSLISGELRKQFGIEDTSNVDIAINNIINTIILTKQSVRINNNGLTGGILLTIVPSNLLGIIDDSSAYVVDSNRGYSLPWLEWLLLRGGDIIVRKFEVKYGSNPASRSGDAIMVSSSKNWRVPAQFAGTQRDNWITRALSTIEDKISDLIRSGLENNL